MSFLPIMVTGDETIILYCHAENKRKSMECRHNGERNLAKKVTM